MSRLELRRAAFLVATASLLACHTMDFEIAQPPNTATEEPIVERKSFWFFGLYPTLQVDLREKCPNGTVAVWDQLRPSDYLLGVLTLGIWTPRTSQYYCRAQPWRPPRAPAVTP